jgi:hypothetical protein
MLRAQAPAATPKKPDEPATGAIDGKVVNESGQPLAGASLIVRAMSSPGNARMATSDVDGNFRVSGLEPALYVVNGNVPAYTPVPSDPNGGPTYYRIGDTVRLELIRGGAITGSVTNSLGEPIVSMRVRATLVRDAQGEIVRLSYGSEQSTDDRGIYRIYGLRPGTYLVSAGGPGFSPSFNPYDMDAATYAPSSTRDTAAEVIVRSAEDSTIDIRYRGEPGHVISGTARGSGPNGVSMTLMHAGSLNSIANTFQAVGSRGFAFNGVADGDYEIIAQESTSSPTSFNPTLAFSEPKKITVKGSDVTGIELVTRPLGSISGKIAIDSSKVPECQGKRAPLLSETAVRLQRPEKDPDGPRARVFTTSGSPDPSGAFVLRNLLPGKYRFEPLFYGRYWYLQSITTTTGTAKPQKIDAAANWTTLKSGDQLSNLTITLAQGAATIRGRVPAPESATVPAPTTVYLVPVEPDKVEDVLRYFVTDLGADLTFAFNSVPPGKYFALVDAQASTMTKLRQPESATTRATIRRRAEVKKNDIALKPCQNLTDYQPKQ